MQGPSWRAAAVAIAVLGTAVPASAATAPNALHVRADRILSSFPAGAVAIVDPTNGFVTTPPPIVKRATASYRFGRLRIYIFPYDLARNIQASA